MKTPMSLQPWSWSSLSNATVVSIFPNLCFWRRTLCSNVKGIEPQKLYWATFKGGACLATTFLLTWEPQGDWYLFCMEAKKSIQTKTMSQAILRNWTDGNGCQTFFLSFSRAKGWDGMIWFPSRHSQLNVFYLITSLIFSIYSPLFFIC